MLRRLSSDPFRLAIRKAVASCYPPPLLLSKSRATLELETRSKLHLERRTWVVAEQEVAKP
jgi:hypothetical protein